MVTNGWIEAIAGGAVVGLSTGILLIAARQRRGVSGMIAALFGPDRAIGLAFLGGMAGMGAVLRGLVPGAFGGAPPGRALPVVLLAGMLVGFGARLANGCTSGHGIIGLARSARRSMVAMAIFVAVATLTVRAVPL
jgi:uncharacterized membrane protein YedE/YeeE